MLIFALGEISSIKVYLIKIEKPIYHIKQKVSLATTRGSTNKHPETSVWHETL